MPGQTACLNQVAVVIPCHNEENAILDVVASLPEGLGQWLVVDNGSDYQCRELLKKYIPQKNLLSIPEKVGVGGAFMAGFQYIDPRIGWICKLDGDGQFKEVDLESVLRISLDDKAAFVKTARCNRYGWGLEKERSGSRHWGNQLLTLLLALASGYYLLEDGTSGLFVIERFALEAAEAIGNLRHDHGFETSLLLNLGGLGASVLELRVPVRYWSERGHTFQARKLALPLIGCLVQGAWRRLLRNHLIYRLSPGGVLVVCSISPIVIGVALTVVASIKAIAAEIPTTPGISAAATSLISWGVMAGMGFLAYDFASTFRRFRCCTAFECWQPIATQGIQAAKTHHAKRPS